MRSRHHAYRDMRSDIPLLEPNGPLRRLVRIGFAAVLVAVALLVANFAYQREQRLNHPDAYYGAAGSSHYWRESRELDGVFTVYYLPTMVKYGISDLTCDDA